jgi:chromosome segregation ATPase
MEALIASAEEKDSMLKQLGIDQQDALQRLEADHERKVASLEKALGERERHAGAQREQQRKSDLRLRMLEDRLSSAVGSQSKLSEDLRMSREERILATRKQREMEDKVEEAEEKLLAKDRLVCEFEVQVAHLEAELAACKQKNSEARAKSSQLKAELMADNSSLKDKTEALERQVQRLEVMKEDAEQSKEQQRRVASLEKDLKSSSSECRYWKQQTKELTEAAQKGREKGAGAAEKVVRLERENKMLSSSLESTEDRAQQLALQVAELNATISSTNSKFEQYKNVDQKSLEQFGGELNSLEAKQLLVIESQGGMVRMIDSFLQNRRRMAKLQAVYNDMKSKMSQMDGGEGVFDRLKSLSELEYDLHYMTNKKKSFELKYNELKQQVATKEQRLPSKKKNAAVAFGKENDVGIHA